MEKICKTCHNRPTVIGGEYKTGHRWNQKEADSTEQLDWYTLLLHLKYGIEPDKVQWVLTSMPTEWNFGNPIVTGEIINFETKRTMSDIIRVGKKIKDSWEKLGVLVAEEYKSLGL